MSFRFTLILAFESGSYSTTLLRPRELVPSPPTRQCNNTLVQFKCICTQESKTVSAYKAAERTFAQLLSTHDGW